MQETALCPFENQDVSVSTVSARTAAAVSTKRVRLLATADMRVRFGNSAVAATTADMPLVAGVAEYFDLSSAGHTHVAGIVTSGSGTLSVTAM